MLGRKLRWRLTTSSGVFTDGALSERVKEGGEIKKFEVFRGRKLVLVADYTNGMMYTPVGTFGFDPSTDKPRFFKRRQKFIHVGHNRFAHQGIKTTVCFGVGNQLFCTGGDFVAWKELAR